MAQNRSHAVMSQRVEAPDSFDDFPTPPWATRALVDHVLLPIIGGRKLKVCEPCSNRGYMAKALRESYPDVATLDIFDYRDDPETVEPQQFVRDFLFPGRVEDSTAFFFNPPFRLGQQFITHATSLDGWEVVAALVRTQFLEGGERYDDLFNINPPYVIAQFVERVPMLKGRLRRRQWNPKTEKIEAVTTATSYAWLVWLPDEHRADPKFRWIPPCRKRLEKWGDYPDDLDPRLIGAPAEAAA